METLIDSIFVTSINCGVATIQVYDAATGSNIKGYNGSTACPSSLNFIGNGEYLLCGQKDKPLLQAWAMNKSDPMQIKLAVPGRVSVVVTNSSGPLYCAVGINESIFLYKLSSGRLLGVLRQHYQPVTCLKFTSSGLFLISGGEDGVVMRWNIRNILDALHSSEVPEPHLKLAQHSDKVTDLFASSGLHCNLISTSLDCTANIYDLTTGQLRHTVIAPDGITSIGGNVLGSHCIFGSIKGDVWNMKLLPHITSPTSTLDDNSKLHCHEGRVSCISVTANGGHVVTGGEDGEVKMWKVTGCDTTNGLALQKTIYKGRGHITNVRVKRMERQIFNAADLKCLEVISPITSAIASDDSTEVTINVGSRLTDEEKLHTSYENGLYTTKALELPRDEVDELKSNVELLKSSNSELYKYVINKIL